jgi:hypothetical protein
MTARTAVKKIANARIREPQEEVVEVVANNKVKGALSPIERTRLARKAAFIRWGIETLN